MSRFFSTKISIFFETSRLLHEATASGRVTEGLSAIRRAARPAPDLRLIRSPSAAVPPWRRASNTTLVETRFLRRKRVSGPVLGDGRRAHDPLEGRAEGAFGFVAERQGDRGDGVLGVTQLVRRQQHAPA